MFLRSVDRKRTWLKRPRKNIQMDVAGHIELPALLNDDVVVVSVAFHELAQRLVSFAQILSTEELARASRYRYPKDRNAYIVSRGMLRACLAHYLNVQPEDVMLTYGEEGKPSIDPAHHATSIEFNLSHTDGLIAIAFSRNRRVGIDVEKSRPVQDELEIAEKFFTRAESNWLRSLSESERHFAFLCCWTRKEAYAKATGLGLSETLNPHFDPSRAASRQFSYHPLSFEPDYVGVVAVEGDARISKHVFHLSPELRSMAAAQ